MKIHENWAKKKLKLGRVKCFLGTKTENFLTFVFFIFYVFEFSSCFATCNMNAFKKNILNFLTIIFLLRVWNREKWKSFTMFHTTSPSNIISFQPITSYLNQLTWYGATFDTCMTFCTFFHHFSTFFFELSFVNARYQQCWRWYHDEMWRIKAIKSSKIGRSGEERKTGKSFNLFITNKIRIYHRHVRGDKPSTRMNIFYMFLWGEQFLLIFFVCTDFNRNEKTKPIPASYNITLFFCHSLSPSHCFVSFSTI